MGSPISGEKVLNLGADAGQVEAFRSTDPVILPQPYSSPGDYSGQYPNLLDPTEVLDLCEEVTLWQALPTKDTALKDEYWREMTSLAFTSGSTYIAFADGECPEEYAHDGSNSTVHLKNIGAKKTLSLPDISDSVAKAALPMGAINQLVGGFPSSEGMPGGTDMGTFRREVVRGVKEKEIRLAMTLVMNGWDRLLVLGDTNTNSLEFDGFEQWATNQSCSFHTNSAEWAASGTFSAVNFDRWLAESCAKPTTIFGHPQAIQELLSAYFQLGFAGSQVVNFADGGRITPGFNFAGFVNTGVGRLAVVSDFNFTRTASGASTFQADLWAMRMTHNGEPLVYKVNQFPLVYQDLVPGCTAISFEIWARTALIIKACCAQGKYTGNFTGRLATTCTRIG
jgi:hypothetical protein